MIASMLAKLLGGKPDALPRSHAERRAALEASRAAIDAEHDREREAAQAQLTAAHVRKTKALEALKASEEGFLSELGVEAAQRLYGEGSALRTALEAVRTVGTRVEVRALIDVLRAEDERARGELNTPLEGVTVSLAMAAIFVDAGRDDLISAWAAGDVIAGYAGGPKCVGECSAAVLRAALLGGEGAIMATEQAFRDLERVLENYTARSYPSPSEKQRAAFEALYSTTRDADRAARLQLLRAKRQALAFDRPPLDAA